MSTRRTTTTQDLLQQMSGAVIPVEDTERVAARRDKVVSRLEVLHDELDERRQRAQRRTRKIAMLAVAALPVLAAAGYALAKHSTAAPPAPVAQQAAPARLSVRSGSVALAHGSVPERPVQSAQRLDAGDRVRTGKDGRARVRMHSGTDVEMSPVTELTMGAEVAGWRSESVDLARGRVDVNVPQLPRGAAFEVVTPDASVSVRGTRFTVIVEPGAGGSLETEVAVRDGKALVDSHGSQTRLGAGGHWTSSAARTSDQARPAAPAAAQPASGSTSKASSKPGATPPQNAPTVKTAGGTKLPDVTSTSSLAEQNRLFQAAMDARRRGDDARALALLNQLLGRYPGSPLEQDARVERFRALKRLGRGDEATSAARRYLADHPQGFARDEARQMALDPGN